jgi:hypothetical protein
MNMYQLKAGIVFFVLFFLVSTGFAQKKTIAQIKKELETSPNPPLYVKQVLKKKFVMDTIPIMSTSRFAGWPDSIAYKGKIRKVYGPFEKGKYLVQVLAKLPNNFNRVHQLFLDTSFFSLKRADSISTTLYNRIIDGSSSLEDLAQIWSMGGEAPTRGDIGWVAQGALIPEIEQELRKRKKGEVFKIWTRAGVHIVRKTDTKKDTGFALLMRIFI